MSISAAVSSVLILILILFLIIWFLRIGGKSRQAHKRYDCYARELLKQHSQLMTCPVKEDYRILKPIKALGFFKVAGTLLKGDRFAWVNLSNSTMGGFMKLHTFFFRPDPACNLPMLSIDVIFMGAKRVFVIEIIDPAKISDETLSVHYDRMRALKPSSEKLADMPVTRWYKDVVLDFSIHAKSDSRSEELLFETYKKYLDAYFAMVKAAEPISPDLSRKVSKATEWYVDTLISKGGPAVDMLAWLMGKEKMREYSRTVMFGLNS
jgi:hypothetical protein